MRIPKTDDIYKMDSEEREKLMVPADMNKLAYIELIFTLNYKTKSGKVIFNFAKGYKNKDYEEDNEAMSWEKLKNKCEPTSNPSLVKTLRIFKTSSLGKMKNNCLDYNT